MPMQPSPIAETSKLLLPSLRFCIDAPQAARFRLCKTTVPRISSQALTRLPISMKFLPDSPKVPEFQTLLGDRVKPRERTAQAHFKVDDALRKWQQLPRLRTATKCRARI